jgi:hypothetical protein
MIKSTTDSPDIDLVIIWLLLDDLWRQVQRGSNPCVVLHLGGAYNFGHAQVSQFNLSLLVEEDVQALYISVNDVF